MFGMDQEVLIGMLVVVTVNVHLDVIRDGLEMGCVTVRAMWHHVALMVVTAVGQGVA